MSRHDNPFTRKLTDAERATVADAIAADVPKVPEGRVLATCPIPSAPLVTKAERAEVVKKIDEQIRARASRIVGAALRYADDDNEDMTAEERRAASDAALTDKETPYGLKMAVKVFESYQRKDAETERPALAIQINFGGSPIEYPRMKVEE